MAQKKFGGGQMFHQLTSSVFSIVLTPTAAVLAALIAAGASVWSNVKTNRNSVSIEKMKSRLNRELELLKAKLEHGHLISTTQWNAEFNAYKELWKSVVPVRIAATKIVRRESELTEIGVEAGDVSEETRIQTIKNLLQNYALLSSACVSKINEHAPFYTAAIRKKANEVHAIARQIFQTNLKLVVDRQKGVLLQDMTTERETELQALIEYVDVLEEMIRERMSDVKVANSVMN